MTLRNQAAARAWHRRRETLPSLRCPATRLSCFYASAFRIAGPQKRPTRFPDEPLLIEGRTSIMNCPSKPVLASFVLAATVLAVVPAIAQAARCGMPTSGDSPRASDALYVLRAAVTSFEFALNICDVTDTNTVTASDALAILKGAVGQVVDFNCPVG